MRRSYAGGARASTLTGTIAPTDALLPVGTLLGWPDPADGPFTAVINRGFSSEEKILCSDNTGGFLTVLVRGYDGTAAADHVAGETVQHAATSIDDDEANEHVNASIDVHGLSGGDRVVGEIRPATLKGKTLSGVDNTFTDIPRAASPEMDGDLTDLATADDTLQANIDAEATARADGDTTEADARATSDVTLQGNIDAEAAARIATDATLTPLSTFNDGQTVQDAALSAATAAQGVINTANDTLHARQSYAESAGTIAIGAINAGASNTGSVSFPGGRFTHPPIVAGSCENNGQTFVMFLNITSAGCDFRVCNAGSVTTGSGTMRWHAIQMTSGSASG